VATEIRPSRTYSARPRQSQQPRRVCHGRAAFTDLERDLFLRELKLFRELRVTLRFFQRIQVLALEIFDEREFQHRAVVGSRTMTGLPAD